MSAYQNFNAIPALPVELDFDPVREPVTRNGSVVPDQFWIVNPTSGNLVNNKPSGKNHNPVNYTLMWEAFREGVDASGIDQSQLDVKFNIAHGASAFSVDIIFKRYDFAPIVGEPTHMRFRIYDSHDMTFKRDILCGLYRLWCSNGAASLRERLQVKQKHTTLSDPEKLGAVVAEFPARLEAEAELYPAMMNTHVTKDQAVNFIRKYVATYRVASGVKVNEKMVEEGASIWNLYGSMGDTGYRMFNVMTHIGTHVSGREGTDMARKQARIEQQVQSVVDLPEFKRLVGIAA